MKLSKSKHNFSIYHNLTVLDPFIFSLHFKTQSAKFTLDSYGIIVFMRCWLGWENLHKIQIQTDHRPSLCKWGQKIRNPLQNPNCSHHPMQMVFRPKSNPNSFPGFILIRIRSFHINASKSSTNIIFLSLNKYLESFDQFSTCLIYFWTQKRIFHPFLTLFLTEGRKLVIIRSKIGQNLKKLFLISRKLFFIRNKLLHI